MQEKYYIGLFQKYLVHQASENEVNHLIKWLKQKQGFDKWADEQWDLSDAEMNSLLQDTLFRKIKAKILVDTLPPRRQYHFFTRIAAVIFLLITISLSIYLFRENSYSQPDMIVSVEKGQKANIILPDGTVVWINSDSRLFYGNKFNRKERILQLEGEAYFNVAPDEQRPFTVETKDMVIKALGTTFNVKAYQEDNVVSTVLLNGKVEIASRNNKYILLPDERIILNKNEEIIVKEQIPDAKIYAGWIENQLHFENETFENIVRTLERYYNTTIIFESDELKNYRFWGNPGNNSLESTLQILTLTSPLMYEIRDSAIILRENQNQKALYKKAMK